MFLKWENETIGIISENDNTVNLNEIDKSSPVRVLFKDKSHLSQSEWRSFIEDRIISKSRRDIEKFLFRYGLSFYDPFRIAKLTRIINPKDKVWIALSEDEKYEEIVNKTLSEIILTNINVGGSSIHSPSGENIKYYGVYNDKFGIYKRRYHPFSTDVESEVAVYEIAKKIGVECCPAIQVDEDTVFSEFLYDYNEENIVHFRHIVSDYFKDGNVVRNIVEVRPEYEVPVFQMLVLDYLTFQDDRHLSNFAVKLNHTDESFYPLYDNGRSLFYQDKEVFIHSCVEDPILYSNTFGPVGTYYDHISDMLKKNPNLINTINLDLTENEIVEILDESGINDYKQKYIVEWIKKVIEIIKQLANEANSGN